MTIATIAAISENAFNLTVTITIGIESLTMPISKAVFDTLLTDADRKAYIVSVVASAHRNSGPYVSTHPSLVGAVIVIPN